jgi:general secretion pathway protein C
MGNPRLPFLAAVLLAAVLVASITNWVLTFTSGRIPAEPVRTLPANETEVGPRTLDTTPVARLFGASGDAPTNIRALGVMAEGSTGRGIALIGIEGKPARAVRAGDSIAPGITLAEVRRDGVVVNRSGALQQIRLAAKPAAPGATPVR